MALDTSTLPYRPCVGIMLMNADAQVWVGERIDTPDAWQMPQGGIDDGEDIQSAALRELEEEIGVTAQHASIITKTNDWLYYDLPKNLVQEGRVWGGKYRGQKQIWFLLKLEADDSHITIDVENPEFSKWQWVALQSVPELIVPFKKDIYLKVVAEFQEYF